MFTLLTFGIALLAAIIIPRIVGGLYLQVPAFIALGAAAAYTGFVPLWGGVLIALAPIPVLLMIVLYFYILGKRALAGKMGEERKWMAELVRDDNKPFIEALKHLDRTDVQEITVIAEDKEELLELALERAKEKLD